MSTNDSISMRSLTVKQDNDSLIIGVNSPIISEDTVRATLVDCEDLGPTDVVIDIHAPTTKAAEIRRLVAMIEAHSAYKVQAIKGAPEAVAAMLLESVREVSPVSTQASDNREKVDVKEWVPSGKPVPSGRPGGRRTTQVHGTVRSGRIVRFDGDVILIGDVNPGAKVSATGDVFVLGKINGEVHAGSAGDGQSFIFALRHGRSSLRVGSSVHLSNEDATPESPSIAFLEGDKISLIPFAGKVPR